jgi:CheY-like chemotaxis protein
VTAKVLIVEDDAELQELYLAMLETVDCQAIQVYDGREALATMQDTLPDLIILDLILDEMSGLDFFAEIKQDPRSTDIPVVVVSVLPQERCQELLDTDPRTVFLRKPFRRLQLLEAVLRGLGYSTGSS